MAAQVSSVVHTLLATGPWAVGLYLVPRGVLTASYLAAVIVALFHPDPARRAEAKAVVDQHPFTRRRSRD